MKSLIAILISVSMLLSVSCGDNSNEEAETKGDTEGGKELRLSGTGDQVAGIRWQIPKGWQKQPERRMRVATYLVPSERTEIDTAECAVFFFGSGQGGEVDANIDRWISQVTQPDGSPTRARVKRSQINIGCCDVTYVQIPGTYKAGGGPGMPTSAEHEGWVVMGAIVDAPKGSVFFKMFGSKELVLSMEELFVGMIKSIEKS